MSDRVQPWQREEPFPIETAAVATASVIEIGDLVATASSGGAPSSADDETWVTNLVTTQENFHDKFMGVARDRSRNGDVASIVANTTGVYEFDCAAATFEVGDLVGAAKASGNALENQKVAAVATANLAVGRVAKRYGSNTTTVLVSVVSTRVHGGPQAAA